MPTPFTLLRLTAADLPLMRRLNALFGEAFGEPQTYAAEPPGDAYLVRVLGREQVVALAAVVGNEVVGGLVAYELEKLEQERSEIYVYDLAVAASWRRRGIATALIGRVREIATERGAWVVFIQADYADAPAVALYSRLGRSEEVLHFDIPV